MSTTETLLPKLELRLPRLGDDFVAVFAERRGGFSWEYGGGSSWNWVAKHISEAEREEVLAQLQRAVAQFRRCGKSDAVLLDVIFDGTDPIPDDNLHDAIWANDRIQKCLHAVRDLQEAIDSITEKRTR